MEPNSPNQMGMGMPYGPQGGGAQARPPIASDIVHQANYAMQQHGGLQQQPGGAPTVGGAPGQPTVAAHSNPNSTQNTLQIAEIRDGIVIMNDGSFRSVIMAK